MARVLETSVYPCVQYRNDEEVELGLLEVKHALDLVVQHNGAVEQVHQDKDASGFEGLEQVPKLQAYLHLLQPVDAI